LYQHVSGAFQQEGRGEEKKLIKWNRGALRGRIPILSINPSPPSITKARWPGGQIFKGDAEESLRPL
jgi:hypothetical protein